MTGGFRLLALHARSLPVVHAKITRTQEFCLAAETQDADGVATRPKPVRMRGNAGSFGSIRRRPKGAASPILRGLQKGGGRASNPATTGSTGRLGGSLEAA